MPDLVNVIHDDDGVHVTVDATAPTPAGAETRNSGHVPLWMGLGGYVAGDTTTENFHVYSNAFLNGSGSWLRLQAAETAGFSVENGAIKFQYAGSSTQNSTITWTTSVEIDNSGNVVLGAGKPLTTQAENDLILNIPTTNRDLEINYNGTTFWRFEGSSKALTSEGFATEDISFTDAGSTGATQQDWIEVTVGAVTGYLHVFAAK